MSVPIIDPAEMATILNEVVVRANQPVLIIGGAGIGKSQIAQQTAEASGYFYLDKRMSMERGVDIHGVPDREGQWMKWFPPETLPFVGNGRFPDDVPILIGFDEITSCERDMWPVMYQIFQDRCVGEHKFKPNVRLFGMGNRVQDRGIVNRRPFPFDNRNSHFELVVSYDQWAEEMTRRGYDKRVLRYVRWRKAHLNTYDPDKIETVVATPRTWEMACRYFAADLPDALKRKCIWGSIGEGITHELFTFVENYTRVPRVRDVVANPMGTPVPKKDDGTLDESLCYATAMVLSDELTLVNAGPISKYLKRLPVEFMVASWTMAVRRDPNLYTHDAYLDLARTYQDMMRG